MPEEFEDRDLSGSVFWGVNLRGASLRDVDLSGATFFHTRWEDVLVDGTVAGLVVNGVDVTEFVNERDAWHPLRTHIESGDLTVLTRAWRDLLDRWEGVIAGVGNLGSRVPTESVNGEWSLRDTLRHLVFAAEKWLGFPAIGMVSHTPFALPNTGSMSREWPGIDPAADPEWEAVVSGWRECSGRISEWLGSVGPGLLGSSVVVAENGEAPLLMCIQAVLEETFEHLRYATRDLVALCGTEAAGGLGGAPLRAKVGRVLAATLDCAEPGRLAGFWQGLVGGEIDLRTQSAEWVALVGVDGLGNLGFQAVPEQKAVKNRVHLDVDVADLEQASGLAESLGARRIGSVVDEGTNLLQVMSDPEGNEFCLIERRTRPQAR